jgi:DNA repair protein RecO (recombination protein O)
MPPTESETSRAILLRRIPFSETSLVVLWLTEDLGTLKTVVKGARRPKSPFAARLDLFYHAEITIRRSRRSELHTLAEMNLVETFPGLRTQYRRIQVAAYFVELLEIVTELESPVPELHDLMIRALGYLDANAPDRRAVHHFERELVRLLGFGRLEPDLAADLRDLARHPNAASRAIYATYHRLPRDRDKLLRSLN